MERDASRAPADVARSDLLSWSSIFAGVLSAFGIFVLLSVVALAAGLEVSGTATPRFGAQVASIITGLFIVLAFVSGGWIAAWTADVDEPESAILHGFLVWAAFVVLLLLIVAAGLGGALGSTSRVFSGTFQATDPKAISDAGWAAVFGLVLAVGASVLGAVLAANEEVRRRWPFARR